MRRAPGRLAVACAGLLAASPVEAQEPADSTAAAAADSLPCPQCAPRPQFWPAAASLMAFQVIPAGINMFVRNAEWAQVSLQTIENNLSYPWEWDDNAFVNNQFAHPYHGSLYYNSARSNGYDFWASSLWTAGGSLMWEYAFEAWAPSPNDFVNTTLGGIMLGEALYRASRLPLDNTATGAERTWREIGSLLLNPVGGLNRLVRGEWREISATPPDWRPSAVLGLLDVGYRGVVQTAAGSPQQEGEGQVNVSFLLLYGDPLKDLRRAPFSHVALRVDLAAPTGTGALNELSARGNLASWPLGNELKHQIALFVEYDFFDNPAFTYGGTGAEGGLVTSFGAPGKAWRGQGKLLLNGVILGAVGSDFYSAVEGRDYDYGPGIGTILSGTVTFRDHLELTAGYTGLAMQTVDGTRSSHRLETALLDLRYWAGKRLSLGASVAHYGRWSNYAGYPEVDESADFVRLYLGLAFPGRQ